MVISWDISGERLTLSIPYGQWRFTNHIMTNSQTIVDCVIKLGHIDFEHSADIQIRKIWLNVDLEVRTSAGFSKSAHLELSTL